LYLLSYIDGENTHIPLKNVHIFKSDFLVLLLHNWVQVLTFVLKFREISESGLNLDKKYKVNLVADTWFDVGIIAAGEGLRLKQEGIQSSKCLVPVNGTPLIQHLFNSLRDNQAGKITCIINESSDDLKKYLNEYYPGELNIIVKSTDNSFQSLYEISRFLKPPFLLATCDSIFLKEEFTQFIKYSLNHSGNDAVFAVTGYIDDEKPLYAISDKESRLSGLSDEALSQSVTGGLYFFNKDIQKEIHEAFNQGISRLRYFLRFLLEKKYNIHCYRFSRIIDVDHLNDISAAEEFLLNN
jgi:NDP-sugar pyrophosphorylase family protein